MNQERAYTSPILYGTHRKLACPEHAYPEHAYPELACPELVEGSKGRSGIRRSHLLGSEKDDLCIGAN